MSDFAEAIIVTLVITVVAIVYVGIGSIFADFLTLSGFAWFAMTLAWPAILFIIFMMIGGLLSIIRG